MSDTRRPLSWWSPPVAPGNRAATVSVIAWIMMDLHMRGAKCAMHGHRPYEIECLHCGKRIG